jgi:glycosyltransferase involved in cell wall biosynthesis
VEEAIRSVLNQTFTDYEIIVVEGGSTDPKTVQEIRRLESLSLPKVRFYYRGKRCLAGDNRNFGIAQAQGKYICCLDADDRLRPTYLEVAVYIAEVLGFDLVGPSVQCFGESNALWSTPEPDFPSILLGNQVATVALFRRSAWAHVGGFRDWGTQDEYIPEDWDFWIRLLGHGFRAKTIFEPLMLYRVHGSSLWRDCTASLERHRKVLREANEALIRNAASDPGYSVRVLNPYENLGPLEDSRPSLLLALPFVTIGGAEKLFRAIVHAAVARGERVVVVTSLTLPETVPNDTRSFEQISSHVYPLSSLFSTDAVRQQFLLYLIRRYSVKTMMLAGCELAYHALPTIRAEFPGLAIVDQLFNDSVHIANNRLYSQVIDATIVPSRGLAEKLIKNYGADSSTVHVIPHGVELPDEAPQQDEARLPGLDEGKLVVGFFGRLSEEKGPDLFIEIVRLLRDHSEMQFVMTGAGPEREKVLALIQKYRLEERIYAPGFLDDVVPVMRATHIVVLPSRIDGMPLAVLEAQSLGKPVVASKVWSLCEMVEHEKSGFLCDADDLAAFCRYITLLADDPLLRQKMGAEGRERIRKKYSADTMLESYEFVLRAASRSKQPPLAAQART